MRSTLRSLLAAAVIGAMALASTAASAVTRTASAVKSFGSDVAEAAHDATLGFMQAFGLVASLVTFADPYTGKFPVLLLPDDSDSDWVPIPFVWPAVAPAVNDILALCKIPPGTRVVDWKMLSQSADSNAAPTLAFSFGQLDSLSAPAALVTTYGAALTIAKGTDAGIVRNASRAAYNDGVVPTTVVARPLGILVTAVAATYVPGATGMLLVQLADN